MKSLEKSFKEHLVQEPFCEALKTEAFKKFLKVGGFEKKQFDTWRIAPPKDAFLSKAIPSQKTQPFEAEENTLVFQDGEFQKDLSSFSSQEITVTSLQEKDFQNMMGKSLEEKGRLELFNDSFFEKGVLIDIQKGVHISKPIVIKHCHGKNSSQNFTRLCFKNKLIVQKGAQAKIIEILENPPHFFNGFCSVLLESQSQLQWLRVQKSDKKAVYMDTTCVELWEKSQFHMFLISSGGQFSRSEVDVRIKGRHAKTSLKGFCVSKGQQRFDHQMKVEHRAPESQSEQIFKTLVDDRSRCVFRSYNRILQQAQKTKAFQLNKNLILGKRASVDSQPVLEVYADDVEACHGSTTSPLDDQDMFYFFSRGLPHQTAKKLLLKAFLEGLLDQINDSDLKTKAFEEYKLLDLSS